MRELSVIKHLNWTTLTMVTLTSILLVTLHSSAREFHGNICFVSATVSITVVTLKLLSDLFIVTLNFTHFINYIKWPKNIQSHRVHGMNRTIKCH